MTDARLPDGVSRGDAAAAEARTRRALLHILEDLKRERNAASEARRQWVETVDAIASPMMVHDHLFRVVRANRAYAECAGMKYEEMIGRHYWECFPKRWGPLPGCEKAMAQPGSIPSLEEEFTLDSGSVFLSRSFPIRGGEGSLNALHVFEDVTERRRNERALRELYEMLTRTEEIASVGGWEIDLGSGQSKWSAETFRIFGLAPGQTAPARDAFFSLIHPEDRERAWTASDAVLGGGGEGFDLECRIVRPDGALRVIRTTAQLLRDASGAPARIAGIHRDVTEARQAEATLRESRQRLAVATQSAGMGIWDWDVAANRLAWDARMCELYGVAPEDFGGTREAWKAGLHPDDVEAFDAALAQALAGAKDFSHEFRIVRLGGEIRHLEGHAVVQRAAGGAPARMIGVSRDITHRKLAEAKLRRLNRVYAVLSGINNLIVRARDHTELFHSACRIAVEEGGFISAAIALYEKDAERLVAVAQKGAFEGFEAGEMSTRADAPYGRATAPRAVRERRPVWDDDLTANPGLGPNRMRNVAAGARAVASLPLFLDEQVAGVLLLFAPERNFFDEAELRLLTELANDVSHALDYIGKSRRVEQSEARIRRGMEATIEAIAAALESRDPYTAGHQKRVADLAAAIGAEMGLAPSVVEGIHFGALIHDLGKIQVPAELLAKPTRLTKLEFELIKTHPQAGYDIIKSIEFPWTVGAMVRQHHERLDGSGYPQGLQGDEIALEARILAVADVVEAMASHRPYRPGLGIEKALAEIADKRGKWLDERAVDACIRIFREKGFRLPE